MRIIRLPALVLPAVLLAGVSAVAFGVTAAGSPAVGAATGTATALTLRESTASGDNPPNLNVYPTRVATLTVPATHEVHSPVKVTGTVQAKAGSAWKPAASVAVAYYYRVLHKGKWAHVGNGKTNAHGTFGLKFNLNKLGHLQWQVKVTKQQHGNTIYQASDSAVKTSHIVDRSYVTSFVAMHLHGGTTLGAIMLDWPPKSGGVTYAEVTGTAKFYYRPEGSKTWHYLGSSKTDAYGDVSLGASGTLDGTFKIVFPAQGNFLGSTGEQSLS